MGADIQPDNLKIYEEIYETAFIFFNQTYKYKSSNAYKLFEQLFSCFQVKVVKYEWMTSIPMMIKKYFGLILEDVRKQSIEQFYMLLDLVLLKQQSIDKNHQEHQTRFLSKINQSILKQNRNTSLMIKDSLLFEDDVVFRCTQRHDSVFRQSVCIGGSKPPPNQTIMKEAIFIQNLSPKDQEQISLKVEFYHRFANILESMMTNVTISSLLLRHFQASMKDKIQRKKLRVKEFCRSSSIYKDGQIGEAARQKQKYNQTMLLEEVSTFVQLYTAFIWQFYNLDQLQSLKVANLISYQNINCLILNTVWARVSWIGQRGSEYEQQLLKSYLLKHTDASDLSPVKSNVLDICASMSLNPMKYLKEVTLVYRQIGRQLKNATADDLLKLYRSLFYQLAQKDLLKGKLRMIQIVNSIWNGQKNGQVGYAWITWEAGLGMLYSLASKYKLQQLVQ